MLVILWCDGCHDFDESFCGEFYTFLISTCCMWERCLGIKGVLFLHFHGWGYKEFGNGAWSWGLGSDNANSNTSIIHVTWDVDGDYDVHFAC
jgi:hypothetical protein